MRPPGTLALAMALAALLVIFFFPAFATERGAVAFALAFAFERVGAVLGVGGVTAASAGLVRSTDASAHHRDLFIDAFLPDGAVRGLRARSRSKPAKRRGSRGSTFPMPRGAQGCVESRSRGLGGARPFRGGSGRVPLASAC